MFDVEHTGPGKAVERWREHSGLTPKRASHLFYFDPEQRRIVDGEMTTEPWIGLENEDSIPFRMSTQATRRSPAQAPCTVR